MIAWDTLGKVHEWLKKQIHAKGIQNLEAIAVLEGLKLVIEWLWEYLESSQVPSKSLGRSKAKEGTGGTWQLLETFYVLPT